MIAAYPAETENVEIEKVAEPVEIEGDIDGSENADLTGDESRYYGYRRHGWGGGYGGKLFYYRTNAIGFHFLMDKKLNKI